MSLMSLHVALIVSLDPTSDPALIVTFKLFRVFSARTNVEVASLVHGASEKAWALFFARSQ